MAKLISDSILNKYNKNYVMHFILAIPWRIKAPSEHFIFMPEAVNKIQHAAVRMNCICLVASGYSLKSAGAVIE